MPESLADDRAIPSGTWRRPHEAVCDEDRERRSWVFAALLIGIGLHAFQWMEFATTLALTSAGSVVMDSYRAPRARERIKRAHINPRNHQDASDASNQALEVDTAS